MRKVKLGVVGVDSGKLLITDPCYISGFELRPKDYYDSSEDHTYGDQGCWSTTCSSQSGGQLNYDLGHAGAGVVFSSGIGDGIYDVYAYFDDIPGWGERIVKVEIDLTPNHPLIKDYTNENLIKDYTNENME